MIDITNRFSDARGWLIFNIRREGNSDGQFELHQGGTVNARVGASCESASADARHLGLELREPFRGFVDAVVDVHADV